MFIWTSEGKLWPFNRVYSVDNCLIVHYRRRGFTVARKYILLELHSAWMKSQKRDVEAGGGKPAETLPLYDFKPRKSIKYVSVTYNTINISTSNFFFISCQ